MSDQIVGIVALLLLVAFCAIAVGMIAHALWWLILFGWNTPHGAAW